MQHGDNSISDNCSSTEGQANDARRHASQLSARKRKRTSTVWGNFTVRQEDGTKSCDLCQQEFAPLTSTTSMRYHLENKHKEGAGQNNIHVFESNKADALLCEHLIGNTLPLWLVESEKFRNFVRYLRPSYPLPSRRKLTTGLLPAMRKNLEAAIFAKLAHIKYCSLAIDSWTSIANTGYLAVICQGITQDWLLEHFLLQITPVTQSENAEFVADVVEEAIDAWNIERSNIVSIASDGAATMQCAIQKKLASDWVYCIAHVLNRAVRIGLDHPTVAPLVKAANDISKLFKASPKTAALLEETQTALHLPAKTLKIDNKTRWSSAHKMMKRLCEARPAVSVCLTSLKRVRQKVPSDLSMEGWETLPRLVKVLEPFKDATKFFSQESVPTIGVVSPIIKRLLDHPLQPVEEEEHDEVIAVFKTIVAEDLQMRWSTMVSSVPDAILLSAYLDPRTKDLAFVGDPALRDSMLRKARQRAAHQLAQMSAPSTRSPPDGAVASVDNDAATLPEDNRVESIRRTGDAGCLLRWPRARTCEHRTRVLSPQPALSIVHSRVSIGSSGVVESA